MNSLQARPLHAKSRINSIDVHLWDAGGGSKQDWYVGRSGGNYATVNDGQWVIEIQSNAKALSFLTLQSQTANANLLAINLTPSAQIGKTL